ncbi:MAG: hypothetical protein PHF84_03110 [bacterium]|nr:hypothetical protein [bacterium]
MKKKNIDELGIKWGREKYICRVCRRKVTKKAAEREEWYYRVKGKEKGTGKSLQYFYPNEVEYLCYEHFRTLPRHEAVQFVVVGYPYFSSRLMGRENISSF